MENEVPQAGPPTFARPPCCAPDEPRGTPKRPPVAVAPGEGSGSREELALVRGGSFLIGSEDRWAYPADGEGPVREVSLDSFRIDRTAVSNDSFSAFADATGYVTDAERFGWSFVFAGLLPDDFPPTQAVADAPWWRKVEGADWRHPEGPQSSLEDRGDHPVVHVSWNDARGVLRPGRASACRPRPSGSSRPGAGSTPRSFPWGDEREPGGEHRMNVWQGAFPTENSTADGYYGTCPVDAFPANGYGLHNVTGNVWEWTADWFDPEFRRSDRDHDPRGPAEGDASSCRRAAPTCATTPTAAATGSPRGRATHPTARPATSASAVRPASERRQRAGLSLRAQSSSPAARAVSTASALEEAPSLR